MKRRKGKGGHTKKEDIRKEFTCKVETEERQNQKEGKMTNER